VLVGRSTYNFSAAVEQAVAAGAARQVRDAGDLLKVADGLLSDEATRSRMGEAGKAFAARHRGATAKTVELISRAMR
jgi:3-deoxy-D-manno-octulosonic-acid transferase